MFFILFFIDFFFHTFLIFGGHFLYELQFWNVLLCLIGFSVISSKFISSLEYCDFISNEWWALNNSMLTTQFKNVSTSS